GETRHRLTKPELRNQALKESERLAELVDERESHRPLEDPVIQDHQLAHRRFTSYDEETQEVYEREHMPKIVELRGHFAARHIRSGMLDDLYGSAGNEADLRTISTALQEMAGRLGKS
ncbi:MAG: hypothetical protein WA982_15265, partial [Rubrobacteraceae bacterium]